MNEPSDKATVLNSWFLYMVRCKDSSLYTGITTDVERRFKEHQGGGPKSAKSLRGKGPLSLALFEKMPNQSAALKLEYKIKQLPKAIKEQLAAGDISIQQLLSKL